MLLRARFARMSVYVGHCRAAIVTKKSLPLPSGPGGCWAPATRGAASVTNSTSPVTARGPTTSVRSGHRRTQVRRELLDGHVGGDVHLAGRAGDGRGDAIGHVRAVG